MGNFKKNGGSVRYKETCKNHPLTEQLVSQIQPIEFESHQWLQQFLKSLFQLKPVLKTGVAYNKFRIVIEFYSGGHGDQKLEHCETAVTEVIDYLREEGCKVPVLIYSDVRLN